MKKEKPKVVFRQFEWDRDFRDVLEWDKEMKQIDQRRYLRAKTRRTLLREHRAEPEGLFIVEYAREKAGFLWLNTRYDIWKDERYIYLHYVFVVSKFRGMKIGSLMMKKAEEYARNKGINRLQLATHGLNSRAHRFYEQ